MNIREATLDDLPAALAIYAHACETSTATWDYEAPTLEMMRERFRQRAAANHPFLVADAGNGETAGFAYASSFHPHDGFRFTVEDTIYVAEGWQRQGIGRQLLDALIGACEARGFRQMIAGISMPGGDHSLRFHEAAGFRKVAEFPAVGWKHGQWLSAHYLQRPLGEGAETLPE